MFLIKMYLNMFSLVCNISKCGWNCNSIRGLCLQSSFETMILHFLSDPTSSSSFSKMKVFFLRDIPVFHRGTS